MQITAVGSLLVLLAIHTIAGAETVLQTDFGEATEPILTRGGGTNERVTGVMVEGWYDDSGWADDVYANWERMEEEGRDFVRLRVEDVGEHWYQLMHSIPKIDQETFFRLTFTARSPDEAAIRTGIRDSGRPYDFHWETGVGLSSSWREYDYEFRLQQLEQDVGLWLVVNTAQRVDLASLRLERMSRADYVQQLKDRYGERGPRNVLRISRFPLGLQSGWTLGRDNSDGDDVQVGPDPETIGPSGAPALHIVTAEPTDLYSAPFDVPLSFQEHTASMYAKGGGGITVSVRCEGRRLAQQSFEIAEDWQRIALTFQPRLMGRSYVLHIHADEPLWLDALQVNAGDEARGYAARRQAEVALACPESDASRARVQFDDEPPVVRYWVTGDVQGAVLRCKVVNIYGDEKPLSAISLEDNESMRGQVRHDVFDDIQFGPFRVEAWVEGADGERVSTCNELVVNRLPRPHYWGEDAPDSPFGVHTLSTTRHNIMVKAVGANWTRLHDAGLSYLGWYFLEREPGQWTFHDKEIKRYRRDHIKVLGELGTAPEWASHFPGKRHSGYFDRYYQPKRMEDYANYVRTVTERYQGVIDAYDVWNEPWIEAWWGVDYDEGKGGRAGYVTSEEPQKDFVRLMETAYTTAKSVDEEITVLGFNSTTGGGGSGSINGADWTRGVLEAGGLDYCDVICYHQYIGGKPGYPGDVVDEGFRTATGAIQQQLGELPRPVWMTEGSAARDTIGPGFYNHTLPYENTENVIETSDRLCRYMVSLLAQGVEKIFLYSMHAHGALEAGSPWRVIVTPEGYLHPSGAAHGILASHLEDTDFVKVIQLAEGVYAYLFEGRDGQRSVAAISSRPGHADYQPSLPSAFEITDLFGNPVQEGQPLGEILTYVSVRKPAAELEGALK